MVDHAGKSEFSKGSLDFRRDFRAGESGQSTLEYMLVLVITIILVLGLFYQFHRGFRTYAEAFFGGYIACLLETGELPGTVGATECAEDFKEFNPSAEKQLVKGSFGEKGSGNAANAQRNARRAPSGARDAGESVFRGGRNSTVGRIGERGRPASVSEGRAEGGSRDSNNRLMTTSGVRVGRASSNPGRRDVVYMNYEMVEETQDVRRKAKPEAAKVAKAPEGGAEGLRPIRAVENTTQAKTYKAPKTGGGFSVGGLIRMLVIILIVMAMIVFFGGQLLQIAKSREKGGD